jgi:hypothetical protein
MAVSVHGVLLASAELAQQDLGAPFPDADQGGDLLAGQARAGAGLLLGDELGDCRTASSSASGGTAATSRRRGCPGRGRR